MSLLQAKYNTPADILGTTDRAALRPYRVRRGSPCPVCGEDDKCIAIPDTYMHVWCERIPSDFVQRWGFSGNIYYHRLDASGSIIQFPIAHIRNRDKPLASPAVQDSILREIARLLPLSDHHRALLHARSYTDDSIAHHGFSSLPEKAIDRYAIGAHFLYKHEIAEVLGTLGMVQDGRRSDDAIAWLTKVTGSALIQWRRNEHGMITGFLYSPDTPILDSKGKPKKHLMPARMAPSGQPHIAQPVTLTSTISGIQDRKSVV